MGVDRALKYRFADFELDLARFSLSRNGVKIPIEPMVFDLIRLFAANPARILSRDVLVDEVWNGRIVSDATISSCIKAARRALGDSGRAQSFIRTIRGRGFEFTAEVERVDEAAGVAMAMANEAPRDEPPRNEPLSTVSVRPFKAIGSAAEIGDVAEGLASNLSTMLMRVPFLTMVSPTAEGAALWVEGAVQAVGDEVSANVMLLRREDDAMLWGQAFREPSGVDAVTRLLDAVLVRLEPQLVRAIYQQAESAEAPTGPKQLLIRAAGELVLRGWSRNTFERAAELLRNAVAAKPGVALAHAHLALVLALGHRVGLLDDRASVAGEALQEAERALLLDDMDSATLGLAACALADLGQTVRARPLLMRAIELDPGNAQAWTALGSALLTDGDVAEAIRHLEHGLAISSMDPRRSVWGAILAMAHLMAGDAERASDVALLAAAADDRLYLPRLALCVARLEAGAPGEARAALEEAKRINPTLSEREVSSFVGRRWAHALGDLARS